MAPIGRLKFGNTMAMVGQRNGKLGPVGRTVDSYREKFVRGLWSTVPENILMDRKSDRPDQRAYEWLPFVQA